MPTLNVLLQIIFSQKKHGIDKASEKKRSICVFKCAFSPYIIYIERKKPI